MRNINSKLRVLLIGNVSPRPSGSTLLFQQLVENLRSRENIEIRVVNTYRPSHLTTNRIVNLLVGLKTTFLVFINLRWAQVFALHASRPAMMVYGPVLFMISRLFKKPLILRLFGGALEKEYESLPVAKRWVFDKTILAADLLAVETKNLFKYFELRGARNIKWFSNSTKMAELSRDAAPARRQCDKFIFLGLVKEEKGIDVILDSVPRLLPGISVDLFGPLEGKYSAGYINAKGGGVVRYKGVLTSEQVYSELFAYNALILPTFYEGEGYPGVIIEAYSHGMPVISTQWRSIPEIVTTETGILIPPRSSEILGNEMNRLHSDLDLYARLKRGVLAKRTEFSDIFWADQFVAWCRSLVS